MAHYGDRGRAVKRETGRRLLFARLASFAVSFRRSSLVSLRVTPRALRVPRLREDKLFVVMFVLRIAYGVVHIASYDSWIPASAGMTLSLVRSIGVHLWPLWLNLVCSPLWRISWFQTPYLVACGQRRVHG